MNKNTNKTYNKDSNTYHKKRSFGYSGHPRVRKNERIRVPRVRLIGADGKQIGVVPTDEALKLAKSAGLDLVEVSAGTKPPVCRILDFGKYMYEESKKQKGHKTTAPKLKEVKFRIGIEEHDYITKVRRAEEFLSKNSKVKVTLMFRGRELLYKDRGFEVVKRVIKDLEEMASPDAPPRLVGRNITFTLTPLPANKRKIKFNALEEE